MFVSFNLNKYLDFQAMANHLYSYFHFTIVFNTILCKPLIPFLYISKLFYHLLANLTCNANNIGCILLHKDYKDLEVKTSEVRTLNCQIV